MRKLFVLSGLIIGLLFSANTYAQTKISFAKGASSKTITVIIPAKSEKSFSVQVRKNQVINASVSGDVALSKTNKMSVVSLNLTNSEDGVDNWQDGEGFLSILAGTSAEYIFSVANSSSRARTFKMKVAVTDNRDDYLGGIE